MASEKSRNLQEVFLNNIRKSHSAVTVFLVNGVKLQGIVTWFDNFSILLKRDQHVQLCLLYTSPSPRDRQKSRMPSSA